MKINSIRSLIPASILLAALASGALAAGPPASRVAPDEIIIAYRGAAPAMTAGKSYDAKSLTASQPALAAALAKAGVVAVDPLFDRGPGNKSINAPAVHRLVLAPGADVGAVAAELSRLPGVRYAEPNYLGGAAFVPDDNYYVNQASDLAIVNMEEGWQAQITAGGSAGASSSVKVAIIDSGADTMHIDLANIDANSYDFVNSSTTITDDLGHGTRVAGIVGATSEDNNSIAGVAFGCKLLVLDVLDSSGIGTTSNVAEAVRYATTEGVDVINLSLGFQSMSQTLRDACDDAAAAGIVVIAAAGNQNQGDLPFYPASFDSVMGVGSVADDGLTRASFSNYNGRQQNLVEIVAPGVTIYSTIPGSGFDALYGSGTSFSAPMVAGVAALLKTQNPTQSGAAIRAHLDSTAAAIPTFLPSGGAGSGLLDADAALSMAMTPVLSIESITVTDDGDHDGVLDDGETAQIVIRLKTTSADAFNVAATLSNTDPDIGTIADDSTTYATILVGAPADNAADPFADLVVDTSGVAKNVMFSLAVDDGDTINTTLNFSLPVEVEENVSGPLNNHDFVASKTYHVTNTLLLTGDTTIEAGTKFKVDPNVLIRVNSGTLAATGTAMDQIVFTSHTTPDALQPDMPVSVSPLMGPKNTVVDLSKPSTVYHYVDGVNGSDSNTGGPTDPFATIQKGLNGPNPSRFFHYVIVAEGVYTGSGSAVLTIARGQLYLWGGYDSTDWTRDIAAHPTIIDGENQRDGVQALELTYMDGFWFRNTESFAAIRNFANSPLSFSNSWIDGSIICDGVSQHRLANCLIDGELEFSLGTLMMEKNIIFGRVNSNETLTFDSNFITSDAGPLLSVSTTGAVSITNSIFARAAGDAVSITSNTASSVKIANNTLIGSSGTAVSSLSPTSLINNIVWGNGVSSNVLPAGSSIKKNVIPGGYVGAGATGTVTVDPKVGAAVARGVVQQGVYTNGSTIYQRDSPTMSLANLAGEVIELDGVPAYVVESTATTLRVAGDLTATAGAGPLPWTLYAYRLGSGSSAIGTGLGIADSLVPATDIDGEARPNEDADIGADQKNPATNLPNGQRWGKLEIVSGVTSAALEYVTIENGAGLFTDVAATSLSHITATNNSTAGISASVALSTTADNLIASGNLGPGISLPGSDVEDSSSTGNAGTGITADTVEGSSAINNTGHGIAAATAIDSTASGNRQNGFLLSAEGTGLLAEQNGQAGIAATNGASVDDSQAFENTGAGISISGMGLVSNSEASSNAGGGFITDGSTIQDCVAQFNSGTGVTGSGTSTLDHCRVIGNNLAIAGVTTVTNNCAIASNGAGVTNIATIESAYIGGNAADGVVSGGTITDSSIAGNAGDGVDGFSSIDNTWIVNNRGDGAASDGVVGTIIGSTIRDNGDPLAILGGGTRNILSLTGSNIHGNAPFEAFDDNTAGNADRDFTGNWWGPVHAPFMAANAPNRDYDFINDVFDSSTGGNHLLDLTSQSSTEITDAPDSTPPGFVESVTLSPLGAGSYSVEIVTFEIEFSKAMNTTIDPAVTFGIEAPYTLHVVAPDPGWLVSGTTWRGTFSVQITTGNGLQTIRISGATDGDGFLIPDDTSHTFAVDTTLPGQANNGTAIASGSTRMGIIWTPSEYDSPVKSLSKGFDGSRFSIERGTKEGGPFTRITYDVLEFLQGTPYGIHYVDRGLQPDTEYWYVIDQVTPADSFNQIGIPFSGITDPATGLEQVENWAIY